MQGKFVHVAALRLGSDADPAAPGAAITEALCGSWQHPPPCPLAAHHTATELVAGTLRLRTIFAADAAQEDEVRRRIGAALGRGSMAGPDGKSSRWTLLEAAPGELTAAEREHVERIAGT
ncbi:hypothetical protein [Arthrobacter nitrophenolicus]|uniref:Uncharacterized protein n=2 Tax=Arthrobacter nitrophenolicus TaxID=683150 RepID=A0ACC6TID4_9MICC|nr:hypothetical protein [Arthrobacter nitrophenolicus]ELT43925.1 hypothetical protein G205_15345 [Arthrobacter nitrophenolicus]